MYAYEVWHEIQLERFSKFRPWWKTLKQIRFFWGHWLVRRRASRLSSPATSALGLSPRYISRRKEACRPWQLVNTATDSGPCSDERPSRLLWRHLIQRSVKQQHKDYGHSCADYELHPTPTHIASKGTRNLCFARHSSGRF